MKEQLLSIPTQQEEGASLPHYSSELASGADVRAHLQEAVILNPGKSALIPTGLRFAIPAGFEIQVRPRSGLALKHGISVLNTPGTIDADYRGELGIILINFGSNPFTVEPGMRIAQLVVAPVVQAVFALESELSLTVRGTGGFGHTGVL